MRKETLSTGIFYMLASAASLTFVGMLGQIGLKFLSLENMLFWRFFCGFLLSWAFLVILKQGKKLSFKLAKKNLLRAIFVLGSQYCYFYYIQSTSLLNATALLNTGPLFIPLIGWVVFRHKIDEATWIGLSICFVGVLCILQPESFTFSLASSVGLLSGLCQAASQTLFGAQSREDHPILNVCYLFFFCTIGSLTPYLLSSDGWFPEKNNVFLVDLLFLVSLGVLSLCNQLSRAMAYRHATPIKLAAFLYFSVLLSGLIDWVILKKQMNYLSFIGALLIIAGGSLKTFLLFKKINKV